MTTMTWGEVRVSSGDWRPRWAAVVHGSIVFAMLGGLSALWATLALTAALLATPVETMQLFERKGAWGAADVLWQGTTVLVTAVAPDERGAR